MQWSTPEADAETMEVSHPEAGFWIVVVAAVGKVEVSRCAIGRAHRGALEPPALSEVCVAEFEAVSRRAALAAQAQQRESTLGQYHHFGIVIVTSMHGAVLLQIHGKVVTAAPVAVVATVAENGPRFPPEHGSHGSQLRVALACATMHGRQIATSSDIRVVALVAEFLEALDPHLHLDRNGACATFTTGARVDRALALALEVASQTQGGVAVGRRTVVAMLDEAG